MKSNFNKYKLQKLFTKVTGPEQLVPIKLISMGYFVSL